MPDLRDEPVRLTAFGRDERAGILRICLWRKTERVRRALAGWLGAWALAAFSVFIPVAHFVLVPSFLIAGIILCLRLAREDRTSLEARGLCPACGAGQRFRLRGKFVLPAETHCPACRARIVVKARIS